MQQQFPSSAHRQDLQLPSAGLSSPTALPALAPGSPSAASGLGPAPFPASGEQNGSAPAAAADAKQVAEAADATRPLCINDEIEAQCAGWGEDWFPGTIRDLLPNGDIQVLWAGDDPSISNVSPGLIRRRASATAAAPPVAAEAPAAVAPPAAAAVPALGAAAGIPTASEAAGVKRPPEAPSAELRAAESLDAAKAQDAASAYRYELSPGNAVGESVANLRRRVEAKLQDGCRVTVLLHITRPAGRPEEHSRIPTALRPRPDRRRALRRRRRCRTGPPRSVRASRRRPRASV